ncbi:MAG: hypothetical protein IPK53_16615 [bacterium]|nr:hypothetical protein [bacterium]
MKGGWREALIIALAFGLVVRVALIFQTPFDQPVQVGKLSAYNDEVAHVAYTQHILRTGSLPSNGEPIADWLAGGTPSFENYQSPFYYILHALACKLVGAGDADAIAFVGRWLSLACWIGILVVAWQLCDELVGGRGGAIHSATIILLSLSGVMARFSTQAGNEALAWLVAGVISLACLRSLEVRRPSTLAAIATLFVIGLYVKASLLLVAPFVLYTLFIVSDKSPARFALTLLAMAIALAPLAWRNVEHFGGFLPLSAGFGAALWHWPSATFLSYFTRSAIFPWSELWGGAKGGVLMLPGLVLLTAVVGGIFRRRVQSPLMMLFALTVLCGFLWLNLRYDQAEGRYLFVAWPAIAIGIANLPVRLQSPWLFLLIFTLPYLLFVV